MRVSYGTTGYHDLALIGKLTYPNLTIDPPQLDFGCELAGSIAKRSIQIVNSGTLDAVYHWALVAAAPEPGMGNSRGSAHE